MECADSQDDDVTTTAAAATTTTTTTTSAVAAAVECLASQAELLSSCDVGSMNTDSCSSDGLPGASGDPSASEASAACTGGKSNGVFSHHGDAVGARAPSAAAASIGGNAGGGGDGVADVDAMIASHRSLLTHLNAARDELMRQVDTAQLEVERSAQNCLSAVDNRVNQLLAAANQLRAQRQAQLSRTRYQTLLLFHALNHCQNKLLEPV